MMICATTDYAIRIMIEAARGGGIMSSSVLSERTGISQKYLKKITTRLKEAGLLVSIPGHYGGYILSCDANRLTLWDIMEAIEPEKPLVEMQRSALDGGGSSVVKTLHDEINNLLRIHFCRMSLADLVKMSADSRK